MQRNLEDSCKGITAQVVWERKKKFPSPLLGFPSGFLAKDRITRKGKKKRNVLTRATREYLEMSNSNRWLELGFL